MARKRILVVEDHPPSAALAEMVLRLAGFEVRSVGNAATAYDLARCAPPDLMLVDFAMPGTDGLELARKVRDTPELAGVGVVLCSSYPIADDPEVHASGCRGFLAKPLDTRRLGDQIRAFLAPKAA